MGLLGSRSMNKGSERAWRHPSFSPADATFEAPVASSIGETDRALAQALVAGDEAAFRFLVERETPRIFRACLRVLGRVEDAEEATQEAFVLAYRALGAYRGDGHPAAWLTRIAVREAWRRSADRSRRRALTCELDNAALVTPHGGRDPLAEALHGEEQERVRAAVGRLPELYRQVVALRFFAELSLLEIASATGRPEGTVKAQLHRGLKRLRDILESPI
jgi:RNA polymerase sigma-70 factor, ECF subfamily